MAVLPKEFVLKLTEIAGKIDGKLIRKRSSGYLLLGKCVNGNNIISPKSKELPPAGSIASKSNAESARDANGMTLTLTAACCAAGA